MPRTKRPPSDYFALSFLAPTKNRNRNSPATGSSCCVLIHHACLRVTDKQIDETEIDRTGTRQPTVGLKRPCCEGARQSVSLDLCFGYRAAWWLQVILCLRSSVVLVALCRCDSSVKAQVVVASAGQLLPYPALCRHQCWIRNSGSR